MKLRKGVQNFLKVRNKTLLEDKKVGRGEQVRFLLPTQVKLLLALPPWSLNVPSISSFPASHNIRSLLYLKANKLWSLPCRPVPFLKNWSWELPIIITSNSSFPVFSWAHARSMSLGSLEQPVPNLTVPSSSSAAQNTVGHPLLLGAVSTWLPGLCSFLLLSWPLSSPSFTASLAAPKL